VTVNILLLCGFTQCLKSARRQSNEVLTASMGVNRSHSSQQVGRSDLRRRTPRSRRLLVLIATLTTLGMAATCRHLSHAPPPLIANVTQSMPPGLYLRQPVTTLTRDRIVVFTLPERVWSDYGDLLRSWGWTPNQGPFLKRVGALAGDRVCVLGGRLHVNGTELAVQLRHDTHGNPIPGMQNCVTLEPGTFLPLSTHSPRSFDGRYYGLLPTHVIEATARPLWTLTGEHRP
jgi:conjugative transfer signal peptidase TraF